MMFKRMITDVGTGALECIIDIEGYADKEEKELILSQHKYELKSSGDGVFLHKLGEDVEETVFIEHPTLASENSLLFPDNFYQANPSPVVREFFDDIKEAGTIKIKRKGYAADWLVQFLTACCHFVFNGNIALNAERVV